MVNEEGVEVGSEIVLVDNDQAKTTTLIIAFGMGVEHKGCMNLVRKHITDFEQFGPLPFKKVVGSSNNPIVYAELNKEQGTLLMSYMRNSDIARAFKVRLVKRFYDMDAELTILKQKNTMPQVAYDKFSEFKGYTEIGVILGFDVPQSAILANRAVVKACGVNILQELEQPYLVAADQFTYECPTDLGLRFGLASGAKTNKALELIGMQTSYRDHHGNKKWEPTEKGMKYAKKMNTDKKTNSGYVVDAWHWRKEVFSEINPQLLLSN